MKLRLIALVAGVCLLASLSYAERPRVYALKDARIVVAPGKVLVAEYSRATSNSGAGGMLPGRILELSVAP